MRPTQDPKYEKAWNAFNNWQEHKLVQPSFRQDPKRCYYCKKGWAKGRNRTRQHLLPKRRGGEITPENLRWCCYLCNQLLALVDDCPLVFETYKTLILDTPLKHLRLKTAFLVYFSMQNNKYNSRIENVIKKLIKMLDHKKNKYKARKILSYMKIAFPGAIRNYSFLNNGVIHDQIKT